MIKRMAADQITLELLKSGGAWAAALIAVVIYLVRRQNDIDRLHKEQVEQTKALNDTHQGILEKLHAARLADHKEFRKVLLAQSQGMIDALNASGTAQEAVSEALRGMGETLDKFREKLGEIAPVRKR